MKTTPYRRDKRVVLGLMAWLTMAVVGGRLAWRWIGAEGTPSKSTVAASLVEPLKAGQYPEEFELEWKSRRIKVYARYTLDALHQARVEKLLQRYRPDYGAFVALDAATGRVLVMSSFARSDPQVGNLALRASFPAASVFKIVTAAAALDQGVLSPDTLISFTGANHTLYRRNVTDQKQTRWTRQMTLREAFGKSVNTIFGKIGMYVLEPIQLQEYAERFQFNRPNATDLPIELGKAETPEGAWALAEMASGFNRVSSMSPVHGAMIAAAIANDGVMMEPFLVEQLTLADGKPLYRAVPGPMSVTVQSDTAKELQVLMKQTVVSGTSRGVFRTLLRHPKYQGLEVGGKTGSLTGQSPRGKCDWFVGYGRLGDRRIAVAALTVNEDRWRVKASYLARVFLEEYFKPL